MFPLGCKGDEGILDHAGVTIQDKVLQPFQHSPGQMAGQVGVVGAGQESSLMAADDYRLFDGFCCAGEKVRQVLEGTRISPAKDGLGGGAAAAVCIGMNGGVEICGGNAA